MMRYVDSDDAIFSAEDADGIVTLMRMDSMMPSTSNSEWMREAADRALIMTGGAVRSSSPEDFLTDLERVGLIKRVEE